MTYSRQNVTILELDFENIEVGQQAGFTHELTQDDVNLFAALTGDFNPLHVDEGFAKKTQFNKPVVHGMLSASYISTLIGTLLPGSGALWTSQTLDFLLPAFVGDTLSVAAVVLQKSPATRMLVLETKVSNQFGQVLVSGISNVRALEIKVEETFQMNTQIPKTILVTGSSRGIGAAIATRLAELGHRVVINYSQQSLTADELVAAVTGRGFNALAVRANVASVPDLLELKRATEEKFGPIEDVVHCAAPTPVPMPLLDLTWEAFQAQVDVQLKGAFNCAKIFLPQMVERKEGSFLFIGSIFSDGVPPTQQSAYVATKAGLTAFARALAVEYGPKGVRSNVIAPGMTQTDMIAKISDKTKMLTKMNTPLRRLAEPSDIAGVAEFLIGPAGRHITGETIRVCGGISM